MRHLSFLLVLSSHFACGCPPFLIAPGWALWIYYLLPRMQTSCICGTPNPACPRSKKKKHLFLTLPHHNWAVVIIINHLTTYTNFVLNRRWWARTTMYHFEMGPTHILAQGENAAHYIIIGDQCLGRFLGITCWNPSIYKSNRFSFVKLGYFLTTPLKWSVIFL